MELDALSESDPLLAVERDIDQNELIRKVNLKREVADEQDLELDVFVGEGERVRGDEEDQPKAINPERSAENEESDKASLGNKRRKWGTPWAKRGREDAAGSAT